MRKLERQIYMAMLYLLLVAGWALTVRNAVLVGKMQHMAMQQEAKADSLQTVADTLHRQKTRLLAYVGEIDRWVTSTEAFIQELQNQVPETQVVEKVVYVPAPGQQTQTTVAHNTANLQEDLPTEIKEPGNLTAGEKFRKFFPFTAWFVDKMNPLKPIEL